MDGILLQGWFVKSPPLAKMNHFKSWYRRYFVLLQHDDVLSISPAKTSKKLKGHHVSSLMYWNTDEEQRKGSKPIRVLPLTNQCSVSSQSPPCFQDIFQHVLALSTSGRTFYLCAESEKQRDLWQNFISNILVQEYSQSTNENHIANFNRRQTVSFPVRANFVRDRIDSGLPPSPSASIGRVHSSQNTHSTMLKSHILPTSPSIDSNSSQISNDGIEHAKTILELANEPSFSTGCKNDCTGNSYSPIRNRTNTVQSDSSSSSATERTYDVTRERGTMLNFFDIKIRVPSDYTMTINSDAIFHIENTIQTFTFYINEVK